MNGVMDVLNVPATLSGSEGQLMMMWGKINFNNLLIYDLWPSHMEGKIIC